ncbi:MAG: prepilin-type N-terminal cleavage/methylation domain-containing protein [Gammaproteobacteria bacterium]
MKRRMRCESGITLVELVMSIVIIAIAAGAVLGLLSQTSGHSADAMIIAQAVSIGEAYAEEIGLQSFDDPDGSDGEALRADFDDIDDYDGLVDAGARDQFGNNLPGLADYTVSVNVQSSSALTGVASGDVRRIDVRVVNAPFVDMTLTRYRTRL